MTILISDVCRHCINVSRFLNKYYPIEKCNVDESVFTVRVNFDIFNKCTRIDTRTYSEKFMSQYFRYLFSELHGIVVAHVPFSIVS